MTVCRSCGGAVLDTDAFCPHCGADLAHEPVPTPTRRGRSLLASVGALAVAGIIAASIVLRGAGGVAPFADPGVQRAAVTRFDDAVIAGRWTRVHALLAEPPTPDAYAFASLMRERAQARGRIVRMRIDALRLRRSRTVPLLEVHETATLDGRGPLRVVSFYVWQKGRWLFAFST